MNECMNQSINKPEQVQSVAKLHFNNNKKLLGRSTVIENLYSPKNGRNNNELTNSTNKQQESNTN